MATTVNIRTMKGSKKLYLDYTLHGERKRKSTGLNDTPQNRNKVKTKLIPKMIKKIEEIELGIVERTFKYYADYYMQDRKHEKGYDSKYPTRKKIIDHFGDWKVNEITRLDVKRYLSSLDMRSNSKRIYLSTIKGVLDVALDDEAVDKNVATGIQLPREEKKEITPFSSNEVRRIIDHAQGDLKNYLGIAFYTGMRSGEILALMKKDINDQTISVERSISKGKITKPKTLGSIREVPLFDAAKPFIENQMRRSSGMYLFESDDGTPIKDIGVLRKRKWKRLLNDLGIKYRKIYYTRHTFITAMLNSGKYKLLTIAKIAGHSTVRTLMQNYAGFINDEHLRVNFEDDIFADNNEEKAWKNG